MFPAHYLEICFLLFTQENIWKEAYVKNLKKSEKQDPAGFQIYYSRR